MGSLSQSAAWNQHGAPHSSAVRVDADPMPEGLTILMRENAAEPKDRALRLAIDVMPAMVAYVDREKRYRLVNRRYADWYQRPAPEMEGRRVEETAGGPVWKAIASHLGQALAGCPASHVVETEHAGRKRWLRAEYLPDRTAEGEVDGVLVLLQDISDAHRADEQARRNEEQYRLLANALPQMVWVANSAGETEFLNDRWFEYTGAGREEGVSVWTRFVPPEEAAVLKEKWRQAKAQRTPFDMEHRLRRASDGAERWHLARIEPILSAAGEISRWVATAVDIHDRKTSELQLAQARRDLADILESISESFIAVDRDWRFLYANARVADRLGMAREELIGRNMWEVLPEAVKTVFFPYYRQVMEGRKPLHFETSLPPDRWFDVHAHPTGSGMSAYIVEKTEQKRTEEALRQKAKLESVGLLAGGVAHDFNNLLVGILGAADLAQEMVDSGRPEHDLLRLITDSAQRAADLTRQMLTYAGKNKAEKRRVDLNQIVFDTVRLLRSTASAGVQIALDLAPDAPPLMGDPGQIQQIVLNLLTNAMEAIPSRAPGRIEIRTRVTREPAARSAGGSVLSPGDYIVLEVADTGEGMSSEVLDRIFDPFFTTKFTGRGLGLAAVHGIIRAHEGNIEVESVPGQGTTFRVELRLADPLPGSVQAPGAPPKSAGGTVLVIDDEFTVRATAERMLSRNGHAVLLADSGASGIEVFRKNRDLLSAILLDVSLQDQTGFDVLREISGELGDIRVVLSSGHGRQDLESDLARFPGVAFLSKPYRPEQLLQAIRHPA